MDFRTCGQKKLIADEDGFGDDRGERIAVMGNTRAESAGHREPDLRTGLDCSGLLSVNRGRKPQQNRQ